MKLKGCVAALFMLITLGAVANDRTPVILPAHHQASFNSHSSIADTAETPDEHIREKQHDTAIHAG